MGYITFLLDSAVLYCGLHQCLSTGSDSCPPGDMWQRLETFLVVAARGERVLLTSGG